MDSAHPDSGVRDSLLTDGNRLSPVSQSGAANASPDDNTLLAPNSSNDQLAPPTAFRPSANLRDSTVYSSTPDNLSFNSAQPLAQSPAAPFRNNETPRSTFDEEGYTDAEADEGFDEPVNEKKQPSRRLWYNIGAIATLAVITIIAVTVPIVLTQKHRSHSSSSSGTEHGSNTYSSSGPTPTGTTGPNTSNDAVTGGDGTAITTENGTQFTYTNQFGGIWYFDPKDPYNNNAYAQSWSPPLNTTWQWGVDIVRGVNLGGWLVLEPFIAPALFEKYPNTTDEYSLSIAMANDTANGGLDQIETHYQTFITEQDFAEIAAAGLNWVRLPIPFWAIQTYPDEPFLEGVCWKYALKAFQWARKYGIRVNLDLHAVPGSQNGYNHSGKGGDPNFLYGVMGYANAQRSLDYTRVFAEFISQPEYQPVVQMFGILNEPLVSDIGHDVMNDYYVEVYTIIRKITGIGAGHGAVISISTGLQDLAAWADFLPGNDRVALDEHPYIIFQDQIIEPLDSMVTLPCSRFASDMNTSISNYGITTAGEWSLAVNDCAYWLNGVGSGSRYAGTFAGYNGPTSPDGANACDPWIDYQNWSDDYKTDFKKFALASMDSLQNWFFWTWKIGASSVTGQIGAPMWSYQLGLQQGYMPTDPRLSVGVCGGTQPATLSPQATGGAGAGQISAATLAQSPWPPTAIQPGPWPPAELPAYTATGAIPTLPVPTFTAAAATVSALNGWANASDNTPIATPVAGCTYPPEYDAVSVAVPALCGGGGVTAHPPVATTASRTATATHTSATTVV